MKSVQFCGYRWDVKVTALYKVLMAHKHTEDEAVEEAEMATDHIFDNSDIEYCEESEVKVKQGKHFDTVMIRLDLRMDVTAHDVDDAYGEAYGMVSDIELPPNVTLEDAEPYYAERDTEEILEAM